MPHDGPDAGAAGEHTQLYVYIPGCFDVGTISLEGFTLVANKDLALMKAGQPPVDLGLEGDRRRLRRALFDLVEAGAALDPKKMLDMPAAEMQQRYRVHREALREAKRLLKETADGQGVTSSS